MTLIRPPKEKKIGAATTAIVPAPSTELTSREARKTETRIVNDPLKKSKSLSSTSLAITEVPVVELVHPALLKQHPRNAEIYGNETDSEFESKVETNGITAPIRATKEGIVIDGHRRWKAGMNLGLPTVPVIRIEVADESEALRLLVEANHHRVKSRSTVLREYKVLKELETEKAKKRQATKAKPQVTNSAPADEVGKARKIAAKKVGLSHTTAEQGLKVLEVLEKLKKDEESESIEKIEKALSKSVHGAVKACEELGLLVAPKGSKPKGPKGAKAKTISAPAKTAQESEESDVLDELKEQVTLLLAILSPILEQVSTDGESTVNEDEAAEVTPIVERLSELLGIA